MTDFTNLNTLILSLIIHVYAVNIAVAYLDRATEKKQQYRTYRLFLPFGLQIGLGLEARKGWIKIFNRVCYCLEL